MTNPAATHSPDPPGALAPLALDVRNLRKSYGATRALRGVDLEVHQGEIMALVGGNGSGKSTLVKSLAGVVHPDEGTLRIGGRDYDLTSFSPHDSRSCGLYMVHQHRTTFNDLTVTENLSIGRGFETGAAGNIRWGAARKRAETLIEEYGIGCRPDTLLGDLRPAAQTMVEIARALQDRTGAGDGVLVLDEPTASLPPQEVDFLLEALQRFADDGQGVMFISHRLDEIFQIADSVTALRDGNMVGHKRIEEIDRDGLIELIAGKAVEITSSEATVPDPDPPVLEVRDLGGGSLKRASFEVRPGEIVGVAGLAGSGRSTLLRMLFGAQRPERGEVVLHGAPYAPGNPRDAMNRGVAFVPEDRPKDAIFPDLPISENLSVGHMQNFTRAGLVDRAAERRASRDAIVDFGIKTESEAKLVSQLSGGNAQKVSVARWLLDEPPRLLLLDEPSQGVDVGARSEIWEIARTAAARGTAILVVSSDLEELVFLSQRILIMRDGALCGVSSLFAAGALNAGLPLPVAILIALAVSLVIGAINGALVTFVGVDSVIVTLAMTTLLAGLVTWYTSGKSIVTGIPESLLAISNPIVIGIPISFVLALLITFITAFVLKNTPFGRYLHAIGSNASAAHLVGLPTKRYTLTAFLLSAFYSGVAGVILLGITGAGNPRVGPEFMLPAIAAAFLSVAAIKPGRFNVWGAFVAIIFLAVLNSGLNLLGVDSYVNDFANGIALIAGVSLSAVLRRKRA
ncbi:MAG: ATP-binding cassette domain-containing protein [Leucobacter sp.]